MVYEETDPFVSEEEGDDLPEEEKEEKEEGAESTEESGDEDVDLSEE